MPYHLSFFLYCTTPSPNNSPAIVSGFTSIHYKMEMGAPLSKSQCFYHLFRTFTISSLNFYPYNFNISIISTFTFFQIYQTKKYLRSIQDFLRILLDTGHEEGIGMGDYWCTNILKHSHRASSMQKALFLLKINYKNQSNQIQCSRKDLMVKSFWWNILM